MTIGTWIDRVRGAFARDERGQTLVEYALIISVIGVGVSAVMGLLRTQLVQVFSDVINAF